MNMHWCTGKINLAGKGYTIVVIDATEPMSWPELQVMIAMHGDENVYDIKPCGIADVSPTDEKRRLLGKYATSANLVEQVFPGRTFRMEMTMPAEDADLPKLTAEGRAPPPDDEGESLEPPVGPAVFKPGKHPRPSA